MPYTTKNVAGPKALVIGIHKDPASLATAGVFFFRPLLYIKLVINLNQGAKKAILSGRLLGHSLRFGLQVSHQAIKPLLIGVVLFPTRKIR
jgi:hypothetical protein